MSEVMIEMKNIQKRFKNNHVLKGVDLTVNEGETVALLGSSGSGKSTLLRCINLLEIPDEGDVRINDFSFSADKINKHVKLEARRRTAMVFQNFGLFANKTALENVTEALITVRKKSKAEANEQKQRVAISRALALDPKIILFDEPTSALDPELVQEVQRVIRKVAEEKVTMLIVTHEMDFARDVADKVAFMSEGQILETASPTEFFTNPKNERTQKFLERYMQRFTYTI